MVSCDEVKEYPWNPAWGDVTESPDNGNSEEPDTPEVPDNPADPVDPEVPENPETPVEPEVPVGPEQTVGKARLVWIDAAANFSDYANSKPKIELDMKRIKNTGFTGVIVDVRPTNSGVLFESDTEHALTRVDAWVSGSYKWVQRTSSFDYLQAFVDVGKELGLDVYASINTMIGGCYCSYGLGEDGLIYDDPSKESWVSVVNTTEGLMNAMELDGLSADRLKALGLSEWRGSGARFLNPANDEVVAYLHNLLADLAEYDLTGIILDRCRYDDTGFGSDFSDVSRAKFEQFIGETVENWPDDIFAPGVSQLTGNGTELQKKWMSFRAKMIHDFMEGASARVHEVNPDIRFGAYVGAWYSSYHESGVNWASPKYNTSAYYNWASSDYSQYGYADHCDIMIIGAYASTSSIYGSGEWSMQGFCKRAEPLFAGDVPYVGGPDIGNSSGFEYGGQGALMPQIVDACINSCTEGMFFFDLCHIKMYDYWDDIKAAFDKYLENL